MTKATTRRFFFGGTLLFTFVFIVLTIHTHGTIAERTHSERLTADVKRGQLVWGVYNCENCHTLLGEGAYYAPDLTQIVQQRGAAYLTAFLKNPAQFYSEERDGRLMPTLDMTEKEISDVIAFLDWVGKIDTNGWPPRPILVAGVAARGLPGVSGVEQSDDAAIRGKAVFEGPGSCATCHSLAPGLTLVGPSLATIGSLAEQRIADRDYHGDATSAETYLAESILNPSAHVPKAPQGAMWATRDGKSLMPETYQSSLDRQQRDDLIAYLRSLR